MSTRLYFLVNGDDIGKALLEDKTGSEFLEKNTPFLLEFYNRNNFKKEVCVLNIKDSKECVDYTFHLIPQAGVTSHVNFFTAENLPMDKFVYVTNVQRVHKKEMDTKTIYGEWEIYDFKIVFTLRIIY